jgi:hypothetical protein
LRGGIPLVDGTQLIACGYRGINEIQYTAINGLPTIRLTEAAS